MRLTKKVIDSAKYDGVQNKSAGWRHDVRWDDKLSGFGIRIFPSGEKSFVLAYRSRGRKHQMTLGQYGVLTLDQARNRALEYLYHVNNGKDPLSERRKATQGDTINDLCADYLERHAKVHKRTWREDEKRIRGYILPQFGPLKVSSVTQTDIISFHHRIGKRSIYQANRIVALLSKMFELARQWAVLDPTSVNPARGIQKFKETKRDRWVTAAELPELAKSIASEQNIFTRAAFWLYLLTGVRRSELLAAKWSDIDLVRRELRLSRTKAGRTHYVPLSTPAIRLLEQLPRVLGNEYILPGHKAGQPLVNISKAWRRIRKSAGTEDIRLHDLRRTVGSWLAQSGSSLHLIGKILNHSTTSTTAVYARFAQINVEEALEAHGLKIVEAAKLKNKSLVEFTKVPDFAR